LSWRLVLMEFTSGGWAVIGYSLVLLNIILFRLGCRWLDNLLFVYILLTFFYSWHCVYALQTVYTMLTSRDRPIYWPIFGFHRYIGNDQSSRFYQSNPLTYAWTALSWWFWMMRQWNGCSSLAWRSSTAKQCIERSGWNDGDFWNFLLAYSTLFPTRKNFDCISSSLATATVTSWQGGQTTVCGPHAAHKSMQMDNT